MSAVGIRYKNLPETVSSHQLHNLLHTGSIQLIKNIIQQQQRNSAQPVRFKKSN